MGAMTFSKIEKIIFDLAEPIAEENGLYIYDVEFIKEGGHWFLRVYLDKPEENEYISYGNTKIYLSYVNNKLIVTKIIYSK